MLKDRFMIYFGVLIGFGDTKKNIKYHQTCPLILICHFKGYKRFKSENLVNIYIKLGILGQKTTFFCTVHGLMWWMLITNASTNQRHTIKRKEIKTWRMIEMQKLIYVLFWQKNATLSDWILHISVILKDQSVVMYFVTSSCFMADIRSKIQVRDTLTAARRNKGSNIKELHRSLCKAVLSCEQIPQTGRRTAKV